MDDGIVGTSTSISFRKVAKGKKSLIRRRYKEPSSSSSHDEDAGIGEDEPTSSNIASLKRSRNKHRLIHTTSKHKRRILEGAEDSPPSSDQEEEERRKALGINDNYTSSGAQFEGLADGGATRTRQVDTEFEHDAQAQFERVQRMLKEQEEKNKAKVEARKLEKQIYGYADADTPDILAEKKIYKGMAMYDARKKEDTVKGNASAGLNRKGPIRSTQFMRASIRWDYHPEICKDFKETGFCTFGDNCKFMHDRTDYKHGWEIDKDYEEGKLNPIKDDEYEISSDSSSEDDLPFKCFICRDDFKSPVVTKCKHYFCEACALNNFRKTKRCYVCNADTQGSFSVAKDLIAKINETKNKEAKKELGDSSESGEESEMPVTKMEYLESEGEDDTKKAKEESEQDSNDDESN